MSLSNRLDPSMTRVWDAMLVTKELSARHVYWRVPAFLRYARDRRTERRVRHRRVHEGALRAVLERAGLRRGALVMAHSSLHGVELDSAGRDTSITDLLSVTVRILGTIKELIGDSGTLAMPSHPLYGSDRSFMADKSTVTCYYDPAKTPSRVGLLTELFRRERTTMRSLHPLSSLSVQGPLSEELLRDNLHAHAPLPHGQDSSYHRFCLKRGLVVSIGIPLIKCLTVAHVAEEVRDQDWPVRDFFCKRRFIVRSPSNEQEWVVRERRPEYVRSIAQELFRRDLIREGILHEERVGGVDVHWANAGDVFTYMRCRGGSYPYVWPRLATAF